MPYKTCFYVLKIVLLCEIMLIAPNTEAATLAKQKKTEYRILLPETSPGSSKNAANELRNFLKLSTGADFKIVSDFSVGQKYIAVGPAAAKRIAPDSNLNLETFGHDGILIDVRKDGHVILTGAEEGSRGTLNAVYTFLEDTVGFRWWTPSAMKTPIHDTLDIKPFKQQYIPPFSYREVADPDAREGYYAVRNRLNARPRGEWGSRIIYGDGNYLEFCHTFYHHVPPKKYFKLHPEWYGYSREHKQRIALEGNGYPGQLCLSNRELLEFYKGVVRKLLKRSPAETIVSVSQMDSCGPCQCTECLAIDAEEGAPSGKLIRFVNAIADDIKNDFPQAKIDTLAYTHNRKAPKTAPHSNVQIRLCSIECSYAHPFTHPENADFMRDLKAWHALGANLFIWDYTVNFANYLLPHPGLRVLGENMKTLAQNGVKGVFMQGCHSTRNGEFAALRSWVLAKLLWNPYRDCNELIREFCLNYYGPAGKEILNYIALLERNLDKSGEKLTVFDYNTHRAYLKPEVLYQAEKLFESAFQAAGNNTELRNRLEQAQMPLLFAIVMEYNGYAKYLKEQNFPVPERSRYFAKLEEINRKFPLSQVREGASFSDWLAENRNFVRKQSVLPPQLVGTQAYKEIQDSAFSLGKPVPDPLSSDSAAATMKAAKEKNWLIQIQQLPIDGKIYKIYAEIRVKFIDQQKEKISFGWGLYDPKKKQSILLRTIVVPQKQDNRYILYFLGENKFTPGQYLWFSQSPDADIFVDRLILTVK